MSYMNGIWKQTAGLCHVLFLDDIFLCDLKLLSNVTECFLFYT